jgi:hypothetical protein
MAALGATGESEAALLAGTAGRDRRLNAPRR